MAINLDETRLNELERLPNTASPAVVRELARRLRTAESEAVKSEQFSLAVLESEWANGYAAALKDAACGTRALEVKP